MFERLRVLPEHTIKDYRPWHKLLRVHLFIYVLFLTAFSLTYFFLVDQISSENALQHFQKKLTNYYLIVLITQIVVLVGFHWDIFKQVLAGFFYAPVSPFNLALFRIVIMGTIAGHLFVYVPDHFLPITSLPDSSRVPLTFTAWYVDWLPISPSLFRVMTILAGLACLMATVGYKTKTSLLVAVPLLIYVLGVPNFFGKLNHYHFMVWVTAFLAFSPCDEQWSINALLNRKRKILPSTQAHYRYGLAMKIALFQLGLLYFCSALGKLGLGGLEWALSDNLVNLMRLEWLEHYGNVPAIRVDRYPWLCRLGGLGVISFEFAYIFLILSPKTRIFAAVSAFSFHEMTGYFLKIDFIFLKNLNFFHLDLKKLLDQVWLGIKNPWSFGLGLSVWLAFLFKNPAMVAPMLILLAGHLLAVFKILPSWVRLDGKIRLDSKPQTISPWLLRTGVFIISINFIFGIFQIDSWPFSAYPSYSFVRGNTVTYVIFETTGQGNCTNLDEMSQQAKYRKENIMPMAERAAYLWDKRSWIDFEAHLMNYWLRYTEKVPALKSCSGARVMYKVLTINPDIKNKTAWEEELGEINKQENEWTWQQKGPKSD